MSHLPTASTLQPYFALRRQTWLIIAGAVFLFFLLVGFGAFSAGAVSNVSADNGPAILISWTTDTLLDLSFVGLWLLAAVGVGGRLTNRWTRGIDPFMRASTAAAVGIGAIGFAILGLGLIGGLNRATGWGLLAACVASLPWRRAAAVGPWLKGRCSHGLFVLPFAIVFAFLIVWASLPPGFLWKPLDPHPYDVVSYHLQIPREWYEIGGIAPLPHNSFSYFPMGQEMHSLLAMHLLGGPWAAMYAAQLISVAFTGLTVLAVIGFVRQSGGGGLAWLAGLLTLTVPWTLMLGSVAYVESGVTLYATLAVVWAAGRQRTGDLALAGLCLGLAGGIKYTALAMTATPLLLLWPLVHWRGGRRLIKPWLAMAIVCGLVVSPWMIRNTVWTGNPVFPLVTSVFGDGPFTADQVDRYVTAHAPPPAERSIVRRLGAAWDRVGVDPQFGYVVMPLAGVGVLLAWRRRTPATLVGVMLPATTLVWLLATHDMPRFLAPVIPLVTMTVPAWPARRSIRWPLVVGSIAAIGIGFGWTLGTAGPDVDRGRQGLYRLNDLTAIMPPDVEAVRKTGGKLALVGDAQAFFYDFPAGRLKYRGVFDVVVPPGTTLADGWLGEPIERLRAEGWSVLIAPSELARLSSTYAHLPKPTVPFDDPNGAAIVLPPTDRASR